MKTKIISKISLALCAVILLNCMCNTPCFSVSEHNNSPEALQETTKINNYITNQKSIFTERFCNFFDSFLSKDNTEPDGKGDKVQIRFPFIIVPFHDTPGILKDISMWLWIGTKVKVKGYSGDFTCVEYVLDDKEYQGYIFSLFLDDDKEGTLQVRDYDHIYEGTSKEIKFNYNGAKAIKWSVSQTSSYIECKDIDGGIQIKGLKPGTAKITVTAGSEKEEIDVHCIYKWKKNWTGKALTETEIRIGPGKEYDVRKQINSNDRFYVHGDEGGSAGWAYGYSTIDGIDYWGFIDISKLSQKNTVSFYNSLGWIWPLQDPSIKYITSTYGPRSATTGSSNHRGIDVTTGVAGEIAGEPLVAPFDGTVKKVGYDSRCGYYICITSKETDPTTGYKIIAIYMHMNSSALYDSQKEVSKGAVVGYVGTTGESSGFHLHMEANNKNAGIGDSGRTTYTYTINPLYFYMNITPKFSNNDSYKAHGGYWYSENA